MYVYMYVRTTRTEGKMLATYVCERDEVGEKEGGDGVAGDRSRVKKCDVQ